MKNWKQLTTLLIALLINTTLALQIEEIEPHYEDLITDAIENAEGAHHRSGNCYENEDSVTLSCFEAGPHWIGDFNKDGEDDILIRFQDDGLGGGGNAFGYDYIMLILKDGKVVDKETIFGGGKFSETHLTIDDVSNGVVYGTQTGNTHYGEPENATAVQFRYVNGTIQKR